MGYLFTHVTNDVFWSPHLKQGHRTRYLFLGDHNPAANKGTPRIKEHLSAQCKLQCKLQLGCKPQLCKSQLRDLFIQSLHSKVQSLVIRQPGTCHFRTPA